MFTNFAVINIDDDYGRKLCESINIPFKTYAINNDADIVASKFLVGTDGGILGRKDTKKI